MRHPPHSCHDDALGFRMVWPPISRRKSGSRILRFPSKIFSTEGTIKKKSLSSYSSLPSLVVVRGKGPSIDYGGHRIGKGDACLHG